MRNQKILFFKDRSEFNLYLISLIILFFELICIRWISSNIRYIGFFNNTILIAAFLGIGLGCLLKNRSRDYINYFPYLLFFFVFIL
ncbi:MAG: hypothetical protein B6U97_04130 [Candidatus Altiarchaeales archaeon ex4484_96]|nr:MAG: hypothetical protein B6U97_04130 [Candidatus Altiarchaeales archaeon ex4484_96]